MSSTACLVLHCDIEKCHETLHMPMPKQGANEHEMADHYFQQVADAGWEVECERHLCWNHGRRGARRAPTPELHRVRER